VLNPGLPDLDPIIDSAEAIVARDGVHALTIRTLTQATGASIGSIYRVFGSRGGLLGRLWIRAERRFMVLLTSLIDQADSQPCGDPFEVVFAAAEASLLYPQQYPRSAALLMSVRRDEALSHRMPREVVEQLKALDDELAEVISRLAMGLWGRDDPQAVELIATCIIDLPKWTVLRGKRYRGHLSREYVRAAVRGILEVGPRPVASDRDLRPVGACREGAA
jgi:AcrR family transcriptional regulator